MLKKQWPNKKVEIFITSPDVSFEQYPNDEILFDEMLNIMVGDLQRIKEYPSKGFQVEQKIPIDVWSAYEYLVEKGFSKRLIKD